MYIFIYVFIHMHIYMYVHIYVDIYLYWPLAGWPRLLDPQPCGLHGGPSITLPTRNGNALGPFAQTSRLGLI